jgi:hypothetical protein
MPNASPTRSMRVGIPRQRPVLRGACKMVTARSTRSNKQGGQHVSKQCACAGSTIGCRRQSAHPRRGPPGSGQFAKLPELLWRPACKAWCRIATSQRVVLSSLFMIVSSAYPLTSRELDLLKELVTAGRQGVLKPASRRSGCSRLLAVRYATARPTGTKFLSYVITNRGRRALADAMADPPP